MFWFCFALFCEFFVEFVSFFCVQLIISGVIPVALNKTSIEAINSKFNLVTILYT